VNNFHRDQVSGQGRAVSVGEASEMLGVSCQTVRNWIQAGVLKASRTFGNHRRISVRSIKRWNGEDEEQQEERLTVCYSRVSTQAQKKEGNLHRQSELLLEYCENEFQNSRENILEISESASGINENRKGFLRLVDLILDGKIGRVVVSHSDRLSRGGNRLFSVLCERMNVELIIINTKVDVSDEEEMAADIMSLVTVYAARTHGKRGCLAKKMVVTEEARSRILDLYNQGLTQDHIVTLIQREDYRCPKTQKRYSIHAVRLSLMEHEKLKRILPGTDNPIRKFIAERCEQTAEGKCYSRPFFNQYCSWAKSNNLPTPSNHSLSNGVKRIGFQIRRNGSGYSYFLGLKLKGNDRASRSHLG